jgi:hypothetical protein
MWISCRRLRGAGGPLVLSQGGEDPGDNGIAGIVVENDKKTGSQQDLPKMQ